MSVNTSDTPSTGTPLLYGGGSTTPPSRQRIGGGGGLYGSVSRTFSMGAKDADDDAIAASAVRDVHKNALGTFNGCFIPCCLNIMGVILFLKIGWGIGTAGVVGMLLIFVIAEILCILTVLSLSAIITNGDMAGGGSYYMISRSLGPEFGGAIGILFYVAYVSILLTCVCVCVGGWVCACVRACVRMVSGSWLSIPQFLVVDRLFSLSTATGVSMSQARPRPRVDRIDCVRC